MSLKISGYPLSEWARSAGLILLTGALIGVIFTLASDMKTRLEKRDSYIRDAAAAAMFGDRDTLLVVLIDDNRPESNDKEWGRFLGEARARWGRDTAGHYAEAQIQRSRWESWKAVVRVRLMRLDVSGKSYQAEEPHLLEIKYKDGKWRLEKFEREEEVRPRRASSIAGVSFFSTKLP